MKKIVLYFLTWKVFLYCLVAFSIATLSLQTDYLGGGLENYLKNPYLWSYLNFDGVHYLSIALDGYQPLTYFFFPTFPLAVRYASQFLTGGGMLQAARVGLWISNLSFFVALIGLYKLIGLDFKKRISYLTITLLLLFPTSFYFASFYNESVFLALIVWCFYFARKKRWFFAGILGAFATATRVVGIAIIPALIIEAYLQYKKNKQLSAETTLRYFLKSIDWKNVIKPLVSILLASMGVLAYMYYLYLKTGDPLIFIHSVEVFGQQRSSSLVILPQVFYRYFFKVLPSINYQYFPVVVFSYLEIVSAIVFGILVIATFVKLRLSYAVYALTTYIIPTLSGSFSSLPRYVLVIFPAFLVSAVYISKLTKLNRLLIYLILFVLLVITAPLFFRGYWIS